MKRLIYNAVVGVIVTELIAHAAEELRKPPRRRSLWDLF